MKRTRETINYSHPPNREGISGLTFFDGEDESELDRKRRHQQEQRQHLLEQMEEKKRRQEVEK